MKKGPFILTISESEKPGTRSFKLLKFEASDDNHRFYNHLDSGQKVSGPVAYDHVLFDIAKNGFNLGLIHVICEDKKFLSRGVIKIESFSKEGYCTSQRMILSDFLLLRQFNHNIRIAFEKPVLLDGTTEITIENVGAHEATFVFYPFGAKEPEGLKPLYKIPFKNPIQEIRKSTDYVVLKNTLNKHQTCWLMFQRQPVAFSEGWSTDSMVNKFEVVNKNIEIQDSSLWDTYKSKHQFSLPAMNKTVLHKIYGNPSAQCSQIIEVITDTSSSHPCFIHPHQYQSSIVKTDFDLSFLLIPENLGKEILQFKMLPEAECILFFVNENNPVVEKKKIKRTTPDLIKSVTKKSKPVKKRK